MEQLPYNSMYYTFSTIAQVLAAFLALSSVFVLFKLQNTHRIIFLKIQRIFPLINSQTDKDGENLNLLYDYNVPLKNVYRDRYIPGLRKALNYIIFFKTADRETVEYNKLKESVKSIFSFLDEKNLIIILTVSSIIIGGLVIIFSFFVLSIIHNINCIISQLIIYSLGFYGSILCLLLMSIIIIKSLIDIKLLPYINDEIYEYNTKK